MVVGDDGGMERDSRHLECRYNVWSTCYQMEVGGGFDGLRIGTPSVAELKRGSVIIFAVYRALYRVKLAACGLVGSPPTLRTGSRGAFY